MWFLLLAILGGVATEASAQATATQITDPKAIKCDGKTMYAFKAVKANRTDFSDTGTTRPRNRFLRYNNTLVVLGVSTGNTTDAFGYTIDKICEKISTDEGKRYVFTFTSGSSCKAQNVFDNTYWGDNGKQRPAGKANEVDAKTIAFKKGNKTGTIQILVNEKELCSVSGTSIYVSFNSSYTSPIDFEVYEIEETSNKATFKYYQGESKVSYASVTKEVKSESTIAELAEVPTYLTATYYEIKENQEESSVNGGKDAEAGMTYSVRTKYLNDLPFVIDGTTYFSLGSNINTALKATSVPAGDIQFAKYAVKMSGDWINGYLLQDKNNNYLNNTGSAVGYDGSDASKFDIEKSEDNWYLKSRPDGNYLVINTDGTVSFTSSVNDATALKNLSKEQAYNYINTNCPAGHYVGSYSKDQAETISFDQIIKGEGKISISADKYYLFEEAEDDTYFLTSKESTKHMSDLTYTYQVSGIAEVTFSSLWQWKNDMIVNANTGKHLDWEAKLSDKNTISYRSMVDNYNEYKQAYTIELGINENQTYYLKQTGKTSIGSINYKPGVNTGYWFIREADAFSIPLNAVDGKSYATMYAPVKLVQDAEDKTIIYTGNVNGNGNLHLEEWEGGVIPANTPLVLVNEEGAESARFLISYDEPARTVTPDDNWTGTNIKFQFSGDERNNYRLFGFNSAFGVGFFKPKAMGNIPANRGYINISNLPYQTIGLQFPDGTTTSIDAAILNGNNTAEDTPIYDISGRRLMQPTRGQFYIRNGQKFIAQ